MSTPNDGPIIVGLTFQAPLDEMVQLRDALQTIPNPPDGVKNTLAMLQSVIDAPVNQMMAGALKAGEPLMSSREVNGPQAMDILSRMLGLGAPGADGPPSPQRQVHDTTHLILRDFEVDGSWHARLDEVDPESRESIVHSQQILTEALDLPNLPNGAKAKAIVRITELYSELRAQGVPLKSSMVDILPKRIGDSPATPSEPTGPRSVEDLLADMEQPPNPDEPTH